MKSAHRQWVLALVALLGAATAGAQNAPAAPKPATPNPAADSLEPAVATSPTATPAPAVSSPAAPQSRPARGTASGAARPAGGARDRVDLDATQITGNRELPKVLYIVPWKRPDLGDLLGRPLNSLLDEVLAPVDRDVFRRETRYFDALRPDQPQPAVTPSNDRPAPELRPGSQPVPPPGQ